MWLLPMSHDVVTVAACDVPMLVSFGGDDVVLSGRFWALGSLVWTSGWD